MLMLRQTLGTILNMAIGAFVAAAIGAALAVVGTPPGTGPQLVDGAWLNGLAGGLNNTFQSGIAAAGTTQATATQLPAGIYLVEVDTVASGTGVNLPACLPGMGLLVYHNGAANNLTFYPTVANNPITGAQDTINAATSLTGIAQHTVEVFSCAKAGVWAAK